MNKTRHLKWCSFEGEKEEEIKRRGKRRRERCRDTALKRSRSACPSGVTTFSPGLAREGAPRSHSLSRALSLEKVFSVVLAQLPALPSDARPLSYFASHPSRVIVVAIVFYARRSVKRAERGYRDARPSPGAALFSRALAHHPITRRYLIGAPFVSGRLGNASPGPRRRPVIFRRA